MCRPDRARANGISCLYLLRYGDKWRTPRRPRRTKRSLRRRLPVRSEKRCPLQCPVRQRGAAARQCRDHRVPSPHWARCATNRTAHAWPCPCPRLPVRPPDIRSWSARASSAGALPPAPESFRQSAISRPCRAVCARPHRRSRSKTASPAARRSAVRRLSVPLRGSIHPRRQ